MSWDSFNLENAKDFIEVIFNPARVLDEGKPTATVYSDRLFQWDHKKYDELCLKHWDNRGQYFDCRTGEEIEAFLRDYIGEQKLILCRIEQHENKSTGYPLWRFDYRIGE